MGLSVGVWEVLLILIIALIIWGPGKLPEIARTLGRVTRALKKASFDLTRAVTSEIEKDKTETSDSQDPNTETKATKPMPPAGSNKQDNQPQTPEGDSRK